MKNINKIVEALEEILDAHYDMREEKKHSNVNLFYNIKDDRYIPAKDKLKSALEDFMTEIIEED